jgi:hypothetical protein
VDYLRRPEKGAPKRDILIPTDDGGNTWATTNRSVSGTPLL